MRKCNSRSSSSAAELAGAEATSTVGLWLSLVGIAASAETAACLTDESPLVLRTRCERSKEDAAADDDDADEEAAAGWKDTVAQSPLLGSASLSSTLTEAVTKVMSACSSDTATAITVSK